jgi:hypothetical protein
MPRIEANHLQCGLERVLACGHAIYAPENRIEEN